MKITIIWGAVAQFVGNYPTNFVPGEVIGENAPEIGFRPEWVEVDKGNFPCVVQSVEAVGESRYLVCDFKGYTVVLLSREYHDVNEEIKFEIIKYRKYKDGV